MVKRRQDGGKVATDEAQNDIGLDAEQLDMSDEDNDDDIGASEDEYEQDDVRDFEEESSDDGWADVEAEGDSEGDSDSEEEDGQGEGDGDEDEDGDGDGDDEDEDDTVESDSAEAAAGSLIKAIAAAAGSQRATLEGDTREDDEGPAASGRAENGERTEVDPYENHPHEEGSDSSDEERPHRNTVGNVPLEWYKAEDHIGYGLDGEKILRKQRGDLLERLLARNDDPRALRTIYDEYNDEEIELSREELRMLMRIRRGQFPHVEVDPFQPYVDWFSGNVQIHPLSSAPEPKRRFAPSKWEEKKIVKLVRAMRKGWIRPKEEEKRRAEEEEEEGGPLYLMWGDDGQGSSRTASGLSFLPAPKAKLPGHEESYNPPAEYVPTEEERAALELLDEADRPALVPSSFDALRKVPAYSRFIKERFERCLDLYLCPRSRRKRHVSDARTLLPKLPKPRDLRPFPTTVCLEYLGHSGKVHAVAPDASGQWLLSGGEDGTMRVWETSTGRCQRQWNLGEPVRSVAWCPAPELHLASCVAASRTVLMPTGLGGQQRTAATAAALKQAAAAAGSTQSALGSSWVMRDDGRLEIAHRHQLRYVTWHGRGDYFASVAPAGNTAAVVVHQLSKGQSQHPFKKTKGKVLRVQFHPQKPFFFVATLNSVRVYNLAKQALAKKLLGSSGVVTCMDVHPGGDHLLVGAQDKRLAWYDLDLSSKPYKGLRYHTASVRGTCFHPRYPLFASCSDDGTTHVFHGMVYADLMTNPLIVPVKILRGHTITDREGVLDCKFHPTQPWVFTAGSDSRILLYCDL